MTIENIARALKRCALAMPVRGRKNHTHTHNQITHNPIVTSGGSAALSPLELRHLVAAMVD